MREKPRDKGRLQHIKHAIENINRFIEGKSAEDFLIDSLLYFGVIKNLEIIGEASYMLTNEFKEAHPATPWKYIVSMRHILVHGYYQVDPDEVWETINNDLSTLLTQVNTYIEELSSQEL
jgi:uncharacterized protein with HEPN domain